MYTDYWKLACRPFDNAADPRFYYPSETHQATLVKLRYALDHRRGASLLAGMPGLGKTLLALSLLADLPEQYGPRVHLRFPQLGPQQLLAYLAVQLTGEQIWNAPAESHLDRIEQCLRENASRGQHAVIVIDEAHRLCDSDTMETVRLLLNYEPAWTILLVAQPAILPALERMPELEERLAVKCLLQRFSLEESTAYISHRLRAAGVADIDQIFETQALETIHELSDGVPRRINRLADLALLIGFAEEQPRIGAAQVETVADELLATDGAASV